MDDIILFSKSEEDHEKHFRKFFKSFANKNYVQREVIDVWENWQLRF